LSDRVKGKVAFVTGAGRGQGRSHAIRLAEEGADIIAVDICKPVETAPYPMSEPDDLRETVSLVEELGRKIHAVECDVRDLAALQAVLDEGVDRFGRLDIVAANAGISAFGTGEDLSEQNWQEMIDINLTGVWHTCKAAIPAIKKGGRGGAITITSSMAGVRAMQNIAHYVAAKHGVVGLMRALSLELGRESIRVNALLPTNVDTDMIMNQATFDLFRPDVENPGREEFIEAAFNMNSLPVACVEPRDISNALLFLASDEARYITGVCLPVDAGCLQKA
jgi:(+)-trans-carveol dehydrogenase